MRKSVSVIIPCHNSAESVGKALTSVAVQELAAKEIILIDDGSSDGSTEAARASGVPHRLITTNRGNAAAARNLGIRVATGDWLAFLDADSEWLPHHLSAFAAGVSPSSVAFVSHSTTAKLPPQFVRKVAAGGERAMTLQGMDLISWSVRYGIGFGAPGYVLRRDKVERLGGFDELQLRRHDIELLMRVVSDDTWTYDTKPTWATRPPRKGDLSFDSPPGAAYFVRALLKNRCRFASREMERLIEKAALGAYRQVCNAVIGADVRHSLLEMVKPALKPRTIRRLKAECAVRAALRGLMGIRREG